MSAGISRTLYGRGPRSRAATEPLPILYVIYTLQFDINCSHYLIHNVTLEPAVMNALLNVVLLLYSNYITVHEKVNVKVAL
jgi:hypothetical protein